MALTNAFYEAVQSGNVRRVRIMMKNSLLIDPTFEEFHAMEKAASSVAGLYDMHDGKEFIKDKSCWNDEYMNRLMVKVISNFSHERIDHLKEVIRYLRPVTKPVIHKQEKTSHHKYMTTRQSAYEIEKRRCQERGDYLGVKIGVGMVVGATVGGVIASVASAPTVCVMGGIATGTVVGGVSTILIVNGGKR